MATQVADAMPSLQQAVHNVQEATSKEAVSRTQVAASNALTVHVLTLLSACSQVADATPSPQQAVDKVQEATPSPKEAVSKVQDAASNVPSPKETASAVTGASSPISIPAPPKVSPTATKQSFLKQL